jgi:formamidopyrimidine-DNA glycosylase
MLEKITVNQKLTEEDIERYRLKKIESEQIKLVLGDSELFGRGNRRFILIPTKEGEGYMVHHIYNLKGSFKIPKQYEEKGSYVSIFQRQDGGYEVFYRNSIEEIKKVIKRGRGIGDRLVKTFLDVNSDFYLNVQRMVKKLDPNKKLKTKDIKLEDILK